MIVYVENAPTFCRLDTLLIIFYQRLNQISKELGTHIFDPNPESPYGKHPRGRFSSTRDQHFFATGCGFDQLLEFRLGFGVTRTGAPRLADYARN